MSRTIEWLLGAIGIVSCVGGVAVIVFQQPGSLWPLPGLILLEWMLLGLAGFLAVMMDNGQPLSADKPGIQEGQSNRTSWNMVTGTVTGALLALMVMGIFSIGPLVLVALRAFGGTALLAAVRKRYPMKFVLLAILVGAVVNSVLLTALIWSVRS